jgi:4-carboxymuconolactone decarboxylase
MSRLEPITEADLTPEQHAVFDAIQGGPRGNMGLVGPFAVYVRAPGVGNAAQALGAAVRFGTALEENVKEVAICTVGAFFRSKFEFAAHTELAKKAGVAASVIESLRIGETPVFGDERERTAHEIASQLLAQHRLSDELYAKGQRVLGETRLIELVATVGYYTLVSLTLNTFEVPLRDGMTDPFPALPG